MSWAIEPVIIGYQIILCSSLWFVAYLVACSQAIRWRQWRRRSILLLWKWYTSHLCEALYNMNYNSSTAIAFHRLYVVAGLITVHVSNGRMKTESTVKFKWFPFDLNINWKSLLQPMIDIHIYGRLELPSGWDLLHDRFPVSGVNK